MSADVSRVLRGGSAFHDLLPELHKILCSRDEVLPKINAFLLNSNLKLTSSSYAESLRLNQKHLQNLSDLSKIASSNTRENYLYLAAEYILINQERVNTWVNFDSKSSGLLLRGMPDEIKSELLSLPLVDQQALVALKLYASLHTYSDSAIKEYFTKNKTSSWTRSRLLYPILYYYINLPSEKLLEQMLDHLIPTDTNSGAEKNVIKYLILPRESVGANLAYSSYLGLLSHPYDALEFICAHFENRFVARDSPSAREYEQLSRLASAFPAHRICKLLALFRRTAMAFAMRPERLAGIGGIDPDLADAIIDIMDVTQRRPPEGEYPQAVRSLIEFRWSRYPEKSDFDNIDVSGKRFHMITGGRLIDYLGRCLYLFEREAREHEGLSLLFGALVCGCVCPFLLSGPSGYEALIGGLFPLAIGPTQAYSLIGKYFGEDPERRSDRIWINAANWSLMESQQPNRLREWIGAVRRKFPIWVEPRYLSGVDWRWLATIIDDVGILPLRGNPDGVYVLFVRQLEETLRESLALRLAIEPLSRVKPDVEQFLGWLIDEYKRDSLAIVRLFLTADTILKLRLADTFTGALTARIWMLESCVKVYDFVPGVFSERDLAAEQEVLTRALSRMSVGAQQFEIPWDVLVVDAHSRNGSTYGVYSALADAIGENAELTNARRESTYPYSNGAIAEYEGRNRDWPLIMVLAGVVDTILSHPTAGIEAILSVRIRHDAFRREFAAAIQEVAHSDVQSVAPYKLQELCRRFEPPIYREIQQWLDAKMHTVRQGKPGAIFDFIPTKSEMNDLLSEAQHTDDLDPIIKLTVEWVKPRLQAQLLEARRSLVEDLRCSIEARIDIVVQELLSKGLAPAEVTRVGQAIRAATSRRAYELQEWFKVPDAPRQQSLSLAEIYLAVQQRFRSGAGSTRIVFSPVGHELGSRSLLPNQIRHFYDLLSELAQNALKHADLKTTRFRISLRTVGETQVVVASNSASVSPRQTDQVQGHPYRTLHDSLFGEGKSGTKKIAYLSATIARTPLVVTVARRRRSFHAVVPLAAAGSL